MRDIVENVAPNCGNVHCNGVIEMCPRLALVAMLTKIWDSASNNEIIVPSMPKGLDRHRVWQNIAYLVIIIISHWCDHAEIDSHALLQDLVFCTLYGGVQSVLTFCSHCWLVDLSSCSARLTLRNRSVQLLMHCGRLFPDTHGTVSPMHHVCVNRF